MKFSNFQLNLYTFIKLPSVWWCGVRIPSLTEKVCKASVTHRWINQNPFKSMFWAVQGMAAELTTGILIMQEVQGSELKVSMLVLNNKANFTKKAKGRITFSCDAKDQISKAIEQLKKVDTPQTFWLKASGVDENNVVVSTFDFEWTLLIKK